MKKTLLAISVWALGTLGFNAQAAVGDSFEVGDLAFTVTSDTEAEVAGFAKAVKYTATLADVPETVSDGTNTYKVTAVGEGAFYWASIVTAKLPASVTEIKEQGFYNCSLANIEMPGVKKVGPYAFSYTKFTTFTFPEGVEVVPNSCFFNVPTLTQVNLPSTVKTIEGSAFYKCGFETIALPEGLETIGKGAFSTIEKLNSIKLPSTLKTIGVGAFNACTALKTIELPEGLKTIGEEAFMNSGLTVLNLPASLETFGGLALGGSQCATITLAAGNTHFSLVDGTLYNADKSLLLAFPPKSSTTQLTLPNETLGIEAGAFYGSGIQKVTVGNKFRAVNEMAFCLSTLSEINFPESCVFLGEQAFAGTNLTKVTLPKNMPLVQLGVFAQCKALNEVTIPSGVTMICNRAFWNCTSLVTVNCEGMTPPEIDSYYEVDEDPFLNVPATSTLNVPAAALDAYKASTWKNSFTNIVGSLASAILPTATDPANDAQVVEFNGVDLTWAADVTIAKATPDVKVIAGELIAGVPIGDKVDVTAWRIVKGSANNVVRLYPEDYDSYLEPFKMEQGKEYYLTVPAGVVKNAAGELNEEFTLHYVGNYEKPSVKLLSTTPADGDAVKALENLELTFAESVSTMSAQLSNIKLIKGSLVDGVPTGETISVDAWCAAVSAGKTVRLFPADMDSYLSPVEMTEGSDYYLVLPARLFRLSSGSVYNEEIVLHFAGATPTAKVSVTAADPANNSTLEEFTSIKLTFAEAVTMAGSLDNVKLCKGSATGEEISVDVWCAIEGKKSGTELGVFAGDYDGYTCPVKLDKGTEYYLVFPAGFFTLNSDKNVKSEELVYHFSGSYVAPHVELVSTNPADGAELETLGTINFTFAESVTIVDSKLSDIKLCKGATDGTPVAVEKWWKVDGKSSGTELGLFIGDEYDGFAIPVTLEGGVDYFVVLPAGLFRLGSSYSTTSPEIVLAYTGKVKPSVLEFTSIKPADNEKVEQLGTFEFTFAETATIDENVLEKVTVIEGSLQDGKPVGTAQYVEKWWVAGGKTSGTSLSIFIGDEYDGFSMPITLEGNKDYYVTLPAGLFKAKANSKCASAETILHYTAKNDGVEDITVDLNDANVEIYNLSGLRVNHTVPGQLYIVRKGGKASKVIAK